MSMDETVKFNVENEREAQIKETIKTVYEALTIKGYNPMNQMIGYILSGDPTYITSFNNARNLITKIERDEILEELVKSYLKNMKQKNFRKRPIATKSLQAFLFSVCKNQYQRHTFFDKSYYGINLKKRTTKEKA